MKTLSNGFLIILLIFFNHKNTVSQESEAVKKKEAFLKFFQAFNQAIQNGDKTAVCEMVKFPLGIDLEKKIEKGKEIALERLGKLKAERIETKDQFLAKPELWKLMNAFTIYR